MTRRLRLGALLCALILALAGCASLPTDGPVRQGSAVEANQLRDAPRVEVQGPHAGDSPEAVVRGFLRAMADTSQDFRTAREYLDKSAANAWRPGSGPVQVYAASTLRIDATGAASGGGEGRAVSASAQATVDGDGVYRLTDGNTTQRLELTLARSREANDEWRITSLPDGFGRWLTTDEFARTFLRLNVYYASQFDNVLIPDPRWVPDNEGRMTALARLQAAEPPLYLRGAVRAGLPSGSELAVDAVSVDNRVATVALKSSSQVPLTADQRTIAYAEFSQALRQLPLPVDTVRILWNKAELEPGDSAPFGEVGRTPPFLLLSNAAGLSTVTLDGDQFRRYRQDQDGEGRQAPAPTLVPPGPGWRQLAASQDLTHVAAVSGGHTLGLWYQGEAVLERTLPGRLTTPSFDEGTMSQGYPHAPGMWFASSELRGGSVWWVSMAKPGTPAEPVQVLAPWLAGRQVVALRVAPDQTRVLVLVTDPGTGVSRVAVAAVLRDPATARPLSLTQPLYVGTAMYEVTDAGWRDTDEIALLGKSARGTDNRVFVISVGGGMERGPEAAGATSLVSVFQDQVRGLLYLDAQGMSYVASGDGWMQVQKVEDLVSPGS